MPLPSWLSLSRRPAGDARVDTTSASASANDSAMGVVDTPMSDVGGTHMQLQTRRQSQHDNPAHTDVERDANGKDKPAPTSTKQVAVDFVHHNWISIIYSSVSLCVVVLMVYLSFFAAVMDDENNTTPEFLSCRSWAFGTECGLNGIDCRPFESEWTAIRCRSRCTLDQSSSLAVWGTDKYHANSRICRAAVHAGVVGTNGGCAMMRYSGPANAFYGSSANGVTTEDYLSWFPKTFEFKAASSRYCTDLTWPILTVAVLLTMGFALLPRTNVGMLFGMLVGSGFFYVRLVGMPRSVDYAGMAIDAFGEVFVLLAASYWIYYIAPMHTFTHWTVLPLRSRVVLWSACYVVPFYVFLNMNMFEYLPWLSVNLGGYQTSNANAATYVVIVIVVVVVLFCAFKFLRELYRMGLWRRYIVWYTLVITVVLLSWALFYSTDFHLHHTMLGMLFLPLTRFPTPLAAAAQSALLGTFLQGYAAWGWGSYLNRIPTYLTIEKPDEPVILNVTLHEANITWMPIDGMDGYSLRLNKVEVYRGTHHSAVVDGLQSNFTYFVTVAGVAAWGTNGQDGPKANFTTLA